MDLRAVLIVLVVLLCGYLLWLAIRWRRLHRKAGSDPAGFDRDIDRFGAVLDPPTVPVPVDDEDVSVSLSSVARETAPSPMPRPAEPDASSFGFDALLEVRQMRHVIDELRTQQTAMAAEINSLRDELADVRAASRVSPAYAEAVSLVRQGYDVEAVAERCGISVAEAELVRSLSRQQLESGT